MALWTPYAEDVALDLSKTAAQDTHFTRDYSTIYAPQLHVPQEYLPYNGFYAPIGQVSPGGSSSGYDSVSFGPLTPRHVTLSPPASPVEASAKRPYSMVDVDSLSDDPDFQEFERNALRVMAEKNGGALLGNNPRMRRTVRSTNCDAGDDTYRRQRERNNFAAKQSRDRRKLREIHLALKVSYLRKEVAALKSALSTRVCGRCQQTCLC
ncbi:transcription factor VBP-like isoform X1 [Trichoplusia ni]|uniref:Transcription factor VBP-like isoform X1 n=1 Tax=Trichoplusia ni TaxID=7111 RepID=A0A7E5WLT6_TRINI|nr:transcription factor VBP-like isoform X1 [Trichoplusia ni]